MLILKLRVTKSTYYFELSKVDLVDERNIQFKEENQKIFTEHKGVNDTLRMYKNGYILCK